MHYQDIQIERNENGIFAMVQSRAFSTESDQVIIWSKTGEEAQPYRDRPDEEIQKMALQAWSQVNESRMRRKKPSTSA